MKVLFCCSTFLPEQNGASVRAFNVVAGLQEHGANVTVFTDKKPLSSDKLLPTFEVINKMPIHRILSTRNLFTMGFDYLTKLNPGQALPFYLAMRRSIFADKPDILHIRHPVHLQLAGALLKKEFGTPLVLEAHRLLSRTEFEAKRITAPQFNFYYRVETKLLKTADLIVSISEKNKAELIAEGLAEEKIIVIPNAVDTTVFHAGIGCKDVLDTYKGKRLLIYFGYMRENEGLETLIGAMKYVKRTDVHLLMVGWGNIQEKLIQMAKKGGVGDKVTFTGAVPLETMLKLISAAEIFVYPRKNISYHSNFIGLKFYEAAACGKPIITADVGIAAQEIQRYGCGILFEPDNPCALAKSIEVLLRDAGNLRYYSKNALKFGAENSWRNSAKKLYDAYSTL